MTDAVTLERIEKEIRALADGTQASTKKLSDDTNRELKEMRGLIDEQKKGLEGADAVAKERIDKFAASIETKQNALETGFESLKAILERPGAGWKGDKDADQAEAAFAFHKAKLSKDGKLKIGMNMDVPADVREAISTYNANFNRYLRRDEAALGNEFMASMQTGSDPDGGYLVTHEMSQRIVKKQYESSPMRQFATIESISGPDIGFVRDTDEAGAGWAGETQARTETTTPQVGEAKIVAHELYAKPKVTARMLEDAGLDIERWLANKIAERFGRLEATAFFTGNGVNKPRGILTYASGTSGAAIEQIASGHATNITGDAFWDIVYALKDGYANNARFMMNRKTLRQVMKLKDGQGNYLWAKGDIQGGQPQTLCDYPASRAADMPEPASVSAFTASTLPVAFGDFAAAYTIVDRIGISTLRDPYSSKPYVEFYTRKRVGGDVIDFEALKLMVISA